MKIVLVFCVPVLLFLNSCMEVEPLRVGTVTCCELKKAMKSETEVSFSVELHNPNSFPINVKGYDLNVRINGNTIGSATEEQTTSIPANSTVTKTVNVIASTQKLMSGTLLMGLNALFKDEPTTLEIEVAGHIVGNAKGISKRVKVHETYPLQLHP